MIIIDSLKQKDSVTVVEIMACSKTGNHYGFMVSCSTLELKHPASQYGHSFLVLWCTISHPNGNTPVQWGLAQAQVNYSVFRSIKHAILQAKYPPSLSRQGPGTFKPFFPSRWPFKFCPPISRRGMELLFSAVGLSSRLLSFLEIK